MINKTTVKELKNGIRLLYTRKTGDPFVSITYGFHVGSINESDNIRGISHFIEHHCFNGTKHYTKEEIADLPELYGGTINANTCKNVTQYEVQVLKEYAIEGFSLINDLTFYPLFPEDMLEKEKKVVIQEIKDGEDEQWDTVFESLDKLFHASNLQHPIIGYENDIINLTTQDIINYYKKYYIPENCIVSVCADLEESEIIDFIELLAPRKSNCVIERKDEDISLLEHKTIKEKESVNQCKLLYAFKYPSSMKSEFSLLNYVLGGGFNSRFNDELREKQGLCYQVGSGSGILTSKEYMMYVYISYADENKTEHILSEIDRIIKEVVEIKPISDYEMKKSKSTILGTGYRSNEKSSIISSSKVRKFVYGDNIDTELNMSQLSKITSEDISKAVKECYKNPFYSLLKPKH